MDKMVEFNDESEKRLFMMCIAVVLLTVVAFSVFALGINIVVFYMVIIVAIVFGFYTAYHISKHETAALEVRGKKQARKSR